MLARANRLTSASLFAHAIRRGARVGGPVLVVHLSETEVTGPLVGLVVSKQVGNATIRNRVKRRLRALARDRIGSLSGSAVLVIRALPPAATATSGELAAEFDRCLVRAQRKLGEGGQA